MTLLPPDWGNTAIQVVVILGIIALVVLAFHVLAIPIPPWAWTAAFILLFVVVIVATSVLYLALDAMDVFNSVNKMLADIVSSTGGTGNNSFRITAKGVIGGAALLGVVNVVLFTALATLGSFIYNVCADLVGGIELTLAEKD